MTKVFVSTVINAPLERVWRCLADFNGLPNWMPGMKASEIEGGTAPDKPGAIRMLKMAGTSDVLRERLDELDPDNFTIKYAVVEGPMPVKIIQTGMRLRPITDIHGTLGEWFTEIEVAPGKESEGQAYMTRVFNAGFRGLKRHLGV